MGWPIRQASGWAQAAMEGGSGRRTGWRNDGRLRNQVLLSQTTKRLFIGCLWQRARLMVNARPIRHDARHIRGLQWLWLKIVDLYVNKR